MTYTKPFETVYSHYPLKKGKFQAQKTWKKLNDAGELPDVEVMIKAIADQKSERSYLKRQNRFIPPWKHFSTWLNAGCWTDEFECDLQFSRSQAEVPKTSNGLDSMVRALNILSTLGEDKFREFCKGVRMPPGDIEAVEFKFHGKFNIGSLTRGIG